MTLILLEGLRGSSPSGALALYGLASLLPAGSTVRWVADRRGDWSGAVETDVPDVASLAELLVHAVVADDLQPLAAVAKDINEVTPTQFAIERSPAVQGALVGLAADAPLRANGNVAITPICTYSFGTRGTLFGNAAKQDATLKIELLRELLVGEAQEQKGCNTLGFDPAARRQDGAVIGPDPSADGVRGIPALVPLVLRGLATVAPMPGVRRAQGGAFVRVKRRLDFHWPVFSAAVEPKALPFLVARDWAARRPAQRAAATVDAVYASAVLRDERRLAAGRRVA